MIPVMDLPPDDKVLKYYKFKDSKHETRGPYRLQPLATNSMDNRPNLRYAIPYNGEEILPEKQWQWSKDRVMTALENDELVIKKKTDGWTVSYKQYLKDSEGDERKSKAYSIIDGIYTQQGTNQIKDMLGDGKAFSFPKPARLAHLLLQLVTDTDAIVMDSFAGSGTTGHAVLSLNHEDKGNRRFILVEMESNICSEVTAKRLKAAIEGYGDEVPLGGGFKYCRLGPTLFDANGDIRDEVSYKDLAQHVFFIETGKPLLPGSDYAPPLIGKSENLAVYLLYNGVLKDKAIDGGNVLTKTLLDTLPPHNGPKVIYGTSCRIGKDHLNRKGIVFKQIPYEIKDF